MVYRKTPMVETIKRTATAAATYVIQGPTYAAGQVLQIDAIGVTNLDTNNKDITIGFRLGGQEAWIHTIKGVTAGDFYGWIPNMVIRSDCRLLFRVESPVLGNRTVITIVGCFLDEC